MTPIGNRRGIWVKLNDSPAKNPVRKWVSESVTPYFRMVVNTGEKPVFTRTSVGKKSVLLRSGGAFLFAEMKPVFKPVVALDGTVVLSRGGKMLRPHIHGKNNRSILIALQGFSKFINEHMEELRREGVKGVLIESADETFNQFAIKKLRGEEVRGNVNTKFMLPILIKVAPRVFPNAIPKSKTMKGRRIWIPIENAARYQKNVTYELVD